MAQPVIRRASARDILNPQQHGQSNKNAAKSSKEVVTGTGTGQNSAGDVEADPDKKDSSCADGEKELASKADGIALSDGQDWSALDEQRLAGLDFEDEEDEEVDDISEEDQVEAIAGAEFDDDNYDGVGSDVGSTADENDKVLLRVAAQDLRDEYETLEQEFIDEEISELSVGGNENHTLATSCNDIGLPPAKLKDLYSPYFGPQRGPILDLNEDPFAGLPPSDVLYQSMWEDAESSMWRKRDPAQAREGSAESSSNKKRVRFEETQPDDVRSRRSSMSSEEDQDPNEAFPDLFTALEEDTAARQSMAVGANFGIDFGDADSYYDYEEDERLALEEDDDDGSDDSMASYESEDEGDTTDEETEEEHLARMEEMGRSPAKMISPKLKSNAPAKSLGSRASASRNQNTGRPATPKNGKAPKMGTFALDPTRAAMSVDGYNRKIKVQPPIRPAAKDKEFWVRARKANSISRPTSPMSSPGGWELVTTGTGAQIRPPLTPASTLGTMFDGNFDLVRGSEPRPTMQPFAPAFAARPQTSFNSSFSFTEDSEDAEDDIDMEDFIDMDEYASESDEPQSSIFMSPSADPFEITGSNPTPTRSNSNTGTLNHLEQQPSLVGSFRLNQSHARHVSSLASHPAKRASTLESNALQKGRRNAANTPMTPARKKRVSQDLSATGAGIKKQFGSPLAPRRPRSRGHSLSAPGMQETLGQSLMQ